MTIFIILLLCGVLNCLLYEAARKGRSPWYSLLVSLSAIGLGGYALYLQFTEEYGVLSGIAKDLPIMTSLLIAATMAVDALHIKGSLICIAKDLRIRELPAHYSYSTIIAFGCALISANTYAMVSSTV